MEARGDALFSRQVTKGHSAPRPSLADHRGQRAAADCLSRLLERLQLRYSLHLLNSSLDRRLPSAQSAHGDGDVDPQVTIVSEQMGDGGVEDQAVTVHDGGGHTIVDGARRGLPGEPAPVAV